ncbi:MAG: peptide ABC transporter ATP-binding protein [Phycisphaeraceae bacterium]|nr:peptide ABC transporter ATP-binding protein [Phycisphaeraceae bacterium]
MSQQTLLHVRGLKKHFPITQGVFNRVVNHVKAVDDVSFDLRHGECLSLVGESGSGKTTAGRCILRAINPTAGKVELRINGQAHDVSGADQKQLKPLRKHMQMIFQDPYASLNPRMSVFELISEPMIAQGITDKKQRRQRVGELLSQVGLRPQHMQRYPHAFSGGQRQRIGIARALALNPQLIVADEAVSALDVSVQAQVINLLAKLRDELNLTYLFIAHDLSVVRHISDRVAVMYVGKLVELADVETLFTRPLHPYTAALLSAAPIADPTCRHRHQQLHGEVADPSNPPSGCLFHPRCPYAEQRCRMEEPTYREIENGHHVRCHLAESL